MLHLFTGLMAASRRRCYFAPAYYFLSSNGRELQGLDAMTLFLRFWPSAED